MLRVPRGFAARVSVTLFDSSTGDPLTGITSGDVTLYYRKKGQINAVQKTIDTDNFREVDATNMPGVYEVGFSADDLDTLGEFVAVIQENGGVNLEQKTFDLEVVEAPAKLDVDADKKLVQDYHIFGERIYHIGALDPSTTSTIPVFLSRDGKGVPGLVGDSSNSDSDAVKGFISPTDNSFNTFDLSSLSNLGATVGSNEAYDGWYSFELTSSDKPSDGTIGSIFLLPGRVWEEEFSNTSGTVYAVHSFPNSDGEYTHTWTTHSLSVKRNEGFGFDSFSGNDFLWYNDVDGTDDPDEAAFVGQGGSFEIFDPAANGGSGGLVDIGSQSETLSGVTYYDASNIWACGADELIIYYNGTTDTVQRAFGTGTNDLFAIHAVTDQLVYAVGYDFGTSNILLRTDDGGSTWTDKSSLLQGGDSNVNWRDMSFDRSQPNVGVILGSIGSGEGFNVWLTEDSGYTWTEIGDPNADIRASKISVSNGRIWIVGDTVTGEPRIFETLDFGKNWHPVYFDGVNEGNKVHCVDLGPDGEQAVVGYGDGYVGWAPQRDRSRKYFDPVRLQFASSSGADLSPIQSDLNAIQGGFDWDPTTDSLADIRAAIDGINVDLSPVTQSLNEIRGEFFDPDTDSLSKRRRDAVYSGQLIHEQAATVTIRIGERTGLVADDLAAELYKNGVQTPTSLLTSWQEVDPVGAPGIYKFTLTNTDTDTVGDLLVRIEQILAPNSEFTGLEFLDASEGGILPIEDSSMIAVTDTDSAFVGSPGSLEGPPFLAYTNDGGSSFSPVNIPFLQNMLALGATAPDLAAAVGSGFSGLELLVGNSGFLGSVSLGNTVETGGFVEVHVLNDGSDNALVYLVGPDSSGNSTGDLILYDDGAGTDTLLRDGSANGSGDGEGYIDVHATDQSTIHLAGAQWSGGSPISIVLKSTDGGSSWTRTYEDTTGNLSLAYTVDFDPTGQYGYAQMLEVDASGGPPTYNLRLLRTTDSGDTWTSILPTLDGSDLTGSQQSQPAGIHVISEDVVVFGWADGSSSTVSDTVAVYLSEDGGQTLEAVNVTGSLSAGALAELDGHSNQVYGAVNASSPVENNVLHYGYNPNPPAIDDLPLKFDVVGESSVDLTPVTTALDDIQGPGFDPNTDSLEQIRDNVNTVDLTPVTDTLDEIKGGGFNATTDSLEQLRDALDTQGGSISTVESAVSDLQDEVARLLGLSQENVRITGQTYDVDNNLTNSTISIYGSAQDTVDQINPIAVYELTASYDSNNRLTDYRIERVS